MYNEVRHTSRTSGRYQGAAGAWRKANCLLTGIISGEAPGAGRGVWEVAEEGTLCFVWHDLNLSRVCICMTTYYLCNHLKSTRSNYEIVLK